MGVLGVRDSGWGGGYRGNEGSAGAAGESKRERERRGFVEAGLPTEGQVEVICIFGQVMALMRSGARGRLPRRDELWQRRARAATILEARE